MAQLTQRTRLGTVTSTLSGSGARNRVYWSGTPAPASTSSTQAYTYSFSSLLGGSLSSSATITSVGTALPAGWSLNSSARTLTYDGTGSATTTTGIILRATNGSDAADCTAFSLVTTGASTGTGTVQTFQLATASVPGTYPFTVGIGFTKGDAPSTVVTDLSSYQVVIKRTWNDGSIKHAIISGRVTYTSSDVNSSGTGYIKTVTVSRGAYAQGTALTHANIVAANPSAVVTLTGFGSVSLQTLLAGGAYRTWVSGPEMVECHYRGDVGGGSKLAVWFHVRLYADGRKWIRAIVENDYLDNGAGGVSSTVINGSVSYVPSVTIGGSVVYSNGGAALTHYSNTRWNVDGWIGGDPQITPKHDTSYLTASKLVPNYGYWNPTSTATLNALTQTYTPLMQGDCAKAISGTGDGSHIGLMPEWCVAYLQSSADSRAYRAVVADALAWNTRPIVWRDATTKLTIKPSTFSTWTFFGPNQGGGDPLNPAGYQWESAHHPGEAYLAYLLTGDYYLWETLLFQGACIYLQKSSVYGLGTARILKDQPRGMGWSTRSLSMIGGLAPSDASDPQKAVADDYIALLSSNVDWRKGVVDAAVSPLGFIYDHNPTLDNIPGAIQPWMHLFWASANGFGSDLEPLTNMTNFNAVRDWMYRIPVGMLGGGVGGGYCYSKASAVILRVANTGDITGTNMAAVGYSSWQVVWDTNFNGGNSGFLDYTGGYGQSCGLTLDTTGDPWGYYTLTITNISKSNPAVVTYSGTDPNLANGYDHVKLHVSGMTQVDGRKFTIQNLNTTAKTFELAGENSSSYSTFTSGTALVVQFDSGFWLTGSAGSPSSAQSGRWGYMLPAIAYAVDHGATGAQTAWNRVTNATNWSSISNADFKSDGRWGITPRNFSALPYTVPASGTFADVATNTPLSVSPFASAGTMDSLLSDWNGWRYSADYSQYGALVNAGGGHQSPGAELSQGVLGWDVSTGRFFFTCKPTTIHAEGTVAGSDVMGGNGGYNDYGEYSDGSIYPAHTYDAKEVLPAAWGGGSKGTLVIFGTGQSTRFHRPAHAFDLSVTTNYAPTRVISDLLNNAASFYDCAARDDSRQCFYYAGGAGSTQLVHISPSWAQTAILGFVPWNYDGDVGIIHIPAPYDGIFSWGRLSAGYQGWGATYSKLTGGSTSTAPTVSSSVSVAALMTGTAPQYTLASANYAPLSGFVWSTILNCLVCKVDDGTPDVYTLTPPTAGTETTNAWTWNKVTLTAVGGATPSCNPSSLSRHGSWSSFIEIPALRCFAYNMNYQGYMQLWRLPGM